MKVGQTSHSTRHCLTEWTWLLQAAINIEWLLSMNFNGSVFLSRIESGFYINKYNFSILYWNASQSCDPRLDSRVRRLFLERNFLGKCCTKKKKLCWVFLESIGQFPQKRTPSIVFHKAFISVCYTVADKIQTINGIKNILPPIASAVLH